MQDFSKAGTKYSREALALGCYNSQISIAYTPYAKFIPPLYRMSATMLIIMLVVLAQAFILFPIQAQAVAEPIINGDTVRYTLTVSQDRINITGKAAPAMLINGGLPGPTLRFTRGDYAIITVANVMDVETSMHWHGLIPPNLYDGVPYLNTPPILPGESFVYKFRLDQDGTFWYHSHTDLQEQQGVLGAIVIEPEEPPVEYDSELVVVLSDWTNERAEQQLRTLKRGNEWYAVKRGTTQPWNQVIARGAVGAKLYFALQRMPDMQISDNYYDAFLLNGEREREYPDYEPGKRVRVRVVNGGAATYFWLTWGGVTPTLFSSDGLDVVPVPHPKTLIAVSETYDFIVEVPASGRIELLATAMDGSGSTSAFIGRGETLEAPRVPEPDLIGMMQQMAAMGMKMGAPSTKFRPDHNDSIEVMREYAMDMSGMDMSGMDMSGMDMGRADMSGMDENTAKMDMSDMARDSMEHDDMQTKHDGMKHDGMKHDGMKHDGMKRDGMKGMGDMDHGAGMGGMKPPGLEAGGNPEYNYTYLRSAEPTSYSENLPVRNMLFNLTGNMYRYTWSINGVPVSETDKIMIERGEVVRITMNNLTMMHHPMHLHGHYFRVVNENGAYSPLKHTVNVAPMQKVVIEFLANEYNDWFFHCHVLYHINSGMARVFSYGDERNEELENFPLANLTTEANHLWSWGRATLASHASRFYFTTSNLRNQATVSAEYGWNENLELEASYERYFNDYWRVFGGVNVENAEEDSHDELETSAIVGVRALLPGLIQADFRVDDKLRPQVGFMGEMLLFPRIALEGEFEYQADFDLRRPESSDPEVATPTGYMDELTWSLNAEYFLAKNWVLTAGYDNRFGWGGGIMVRL